MSKIKISNVVRSQLPEFIQSESDFENFKLFLEAYYDYLDQTQKRNIEDLRDIDKSLDDFYYQFKKELDYSNKYSGNEKLFLRNLKSLYSSKGSEASFKLLFRLLFGKDVQISYPTNSILIPSDGKWIQEKFVIAEITSGTATDLVGKEITFVGATKTVKSFVEAVKQFSSTEYKIFLNRNY